MIMGSQDTDVSLWPRGADLVKTDARAMRRGFTRALLRSRPRKLRLRSVHFLRLPDQESRLSLKCIRPTSLVAYALAVHWSSRHRAQIWAHGSSALLDSAFPHEPLTSRPHCKVWGLVNID